MYQMLTFIKFSNFYSTNSSPRSSINKTKGRRRKTLKSPESMPYNDLYKGRGKPNIEPE